MAVSGPGLTSASAIGGAGGRQQRIRSAIAPSHGPRCGCTAARGWRVVEGGGRESAAGGARASVGVRALRPCGGGVDRRAPWLGSMATGGPSPSGGGGGAW